MSRTALAKLPVHVRCALNLYERECSRSNPINHIMRLHVQKTSPDYVNFSGGKLRTSVYNKDDFLPLIGESIKPIFDSNLILDDFEDLSTDQLFIDLVDDSIVSKSLRTTKQTSDFTAKIITSFASHYSPRRKIPYKESLQGVYKWFTKLLLDTPVILVLKQKNILYSDSSIEQINKPVLDMREAITELCNNEFPFSPERSYHFTELSYIDLFQLAIKAQGKKKDSLVEVLNTEKNIEWLTSMEVSDVGENTYVQENQVKRYVEENPELVKQSIEIPIGEIFPYDISYNDFYLVTIEAPVIERNHEQLLEIIANSEFELVAARMSLGNDLISLFLHQGRETLEPGSRYEELLERARKARSSLNSVHDLVGLLGSQGLLKVSEGCDGGSIYLTKRAD